MMCKIWNKIIYHFWTVRLTTNCILYFLTGFPPSIYSFLPLFRTARQREFASLIFFLLLFIANQSNFLRIPGLLLLCTSALSPLCWTSFWSLLQWLSRAFCVPLQYSGFSWGFFLHFIEFSFTSINDLFSFYSKGFKLATVHVHYWDGEQYSDFWLLKLLQVTAKGYLFEIFGFL